MLSRVAFTALAVSSLVAAQFPQGYGRFPCTAPGGGADASQCEAAALEANYQGSPGQPGYDVDGYKSDQPIPVAGTNPVQCVQVETTRYNPAGYFCGIAGAQCDTADQCDAGGTCVGGICQGGLGQSCLDANNERVDTLCLGLLYCNSFDTTEGDGTCGGEGAYCQDKTVGVIPTTDPVQEQANFEAFNQFCVSGYCGYLSGNCVASRFAVGESCASDPQFGCAEGLVCNADQICAPAGTDGARSRSRRALRERRSLCPASHTACSVAGTKSGFECIDTASNLEQCGACASSGGVDCTALPGVEAVGCVAGVCEIWSCAEGFSWDAASSSCQA